MAQIKALSRITNITHKLNGNRLSIKFIFKNKSTTIELSQRKYLKKLKETDERILAVGDETIKYKEGKKELTVSISEGIIDFIEPLDLLKICEAQMK